MDSPPTRGLVISDPLIHLFGVNRSPSLVGDLSECRAWLFLLNFLHLKVYDDPSNSKGKLHDAYSYHRN